MGYERLGHMSHEIMTQRISSKRYGMVTKEHDINYKVRVQKKQAETSASRKLVDQTDDIWYALELRLYF